MKHVLPVFLLIGCADKITDTADDALALEGSELIGMDFILDSAEGYEPVPNVDFRMGFSEADGDSIGISYYGGCNHYDGAFTLSGGEMSLEWLGGTEMGCDSMYMEQDDWCGAFLAGGPSVELEGPLLTLTGTDATLVFNDSEIADPDRSLTGRLWTIDTFIEGESASAFNLDSSPSLYFDDAGGIEVSTGCNTGQGSYSIDGSTLHFSGIAYTEMACGDMAGTAEAHIQTILADGGTTHSIDAARLTIERDGNGIAAYTE
jgi:heat shock protein HslJ